MKVDRMEVKVSIEKGKYVPVYRVEFPEIGEGTRYVLEDLRLRIVHELNITSEMFDRKFYGELRERVFRRALAEIDKYFPDLSQGKKETLATILMHHMVGLGNLEVFLQDPDVEEIAINNSVEPVWVYHKKHGWMITNVTFDSEKSILDLANSIGMKVGRQINILNPLMDAHLPTGDRVNATIFPISTKGNTITIRKFARKPWTVTDFILNKTLSPEIAAVVWQAIHYELNVIIAGGTGSGKTSALNAFSAFIPPYHRVISIEDTRELNLPDYLHWVPLSVRTGTVEGKGEVTMLQLLQNSLRMRPDRIIVGEIRRKREAEVLFEAMHTGHSVYATLHADRSVDVPRRLTNPPIDLPSEVIPAVHLVLVQYRHRRLGIRRTLELAEVVMAEEGKGADVNNIYRWRAKTDDFVKLRDFTRMYDEIGLYTGMTAREIEEDLQEKKKVLEYLTSHKIDDIHKFGRIVGLYYSDRDHLMDHVNKNKPPGDLL